MKGLDDVASMREKNEITTGYEADSIRTLWVTF